jgi:hypothetical protein
MALTLIVFSSYRRQSNRLARLTLGNVWKLQGVDDRTGLQIQTVPSLTQEPGPGDETLIDLREVRPDS